MAQTLSFTSLLFFLQHPGILLQVTYDPIKKTTKLIFSAICKQNWAKINTLQRIPGSQNDTSILAI
jgi:hypothetical protein